MEGKQGKIKGTRKPVKVLFEKGEKKGIIHEGILEENKKQTRHGNMREI